MSKVEKKIKELCPNGVEFRKLRDMVEFTNGKGHEKVVEDNGKYILITSKAISTNMEQVRKTNKILTPLNKDDITMVMSDLPNGRALAKCFIVDEDEKYTLNQRVCGLKVKEPNRVMPKFLYYVLNRNPQLLRYDNGVDQTNLKKDDILNISVPIPQMDVQSEVVRILDSFTSLLVELEKELNARKKQYDYYTYKLFEDCKEAYIELDKIGEVTKLAGFEFSQYVNYSDEGTIIALRGLNVKNGRLILNDVKYIDNSDLSKLDRSKLYEDDILYTYVGTVGQVGLVDKNDKYYLAPNVARIRITDEKVLPKYVMYFLLTDEFKKKQLDVLSGTSSMKNITMANIRKFKIPVPSIEKQKEIISTLEKFDSLCNDLIYGLPAEIEKRQKQYEYYRDRLLSFKEVEVNE